MTDTVIRNFDDLPLMLTVPEAAKILRIGRNTMYALVRANTIHSLRIGRKIRISRAALIDYLTNKNN